MTPVSRYYPSLKNMNDTHGMAEAYPLPLPIFAGLVPRVCLLGQALDHTISSVLGV